MTDTREAASTFTAAFALFDLGMVKGRDAGGNSRTEGAGAYNDATAIPLLKYAVETKAGAWKAGRKLAAARTLCRMHALTAV